MMSRKEGPLYTPHEVDFFTTARSSTEHASDLVLDPDPDLRKEMVTSYNTIDHTPFISMYQIIIQFDVSIPNGANAAIQSVYAVQVDNPLCDVLR